jgi:hypothetical protein
MAFAPRGHRRNRPLCRGLLDCKRAENEIGLRAAMLLLGVDVATCCDDLDCLSFAAEDRREEASREDSSLDIIVAASGDRFDEPC